MEVDDLNGPFVDPLGLPTVNRAERDVLKQVLRFEFHCRRSLYSTLTNTTESPSMTRMSCTEVTSMMRTWSTTANEREESLQQMNAEA
jgi:hypothetical protein